MLDFIKGFSTLPKNFNFLLIFLGGFLFIACSKPIPPQVQNVSFTKVNINGKQGIETLIVIKIFNPNDKDFKITINDLIAYKEEEEIATINKKQEVILKKNQVNFVDVDLILKKEALLSSIFSILTNQKTNITLKGNLTYHHWSNDYKVDFQETFPINLAELFK